VGIILVVEDEVLIRLDLAQQLRAAGFTVLEASTAHEAKMILKATDDVALVVTDVRMPGEIDGLGLASWIRLERPATIVIVLSGHIPALRLATLADAALAKPVRPGQLVREVKRLLGVD
jgi:CheY-like chemotaxis protein